MDSIQYDRVSICGLDEYSTRVVPHDAEVKDIETKGFALSRVWCDRHGVEHGSRYFLVPRGDIKKITWAEGELRASFGLESASMGVERE